VTPERWQDVERLYHAALEREGDQRAAFLTVACGDDAALLREIESLPAYRARPAELHRETRVGCAPGTRRQYRE
jgi:hypothetical protein